MRHTLSADELLTTTRSVRRRLDLSRAVDREVLEQCFLIAQQAPSASDRQNFHFLVVTDAARRATLGDLYRHGLEIYKREARSLYNEKRDTLQDETRRLRLLSSLEHLASHINEVPVHVIPCVQGSLEVDQPAAVAALMASVIPAAWSFMLAARARGLGTCWTTLHLHSATETARLLGIPSGLVQVGLVPTAYTLGDGFRTASRRPLSEIVHWESW